MTRRTLVRIIEAFFRNWFLYLIPLVATAIIGVVNFSGSSDEYTSGGSVLVDSGSLVTSQSGVDVDEEFTFLTPAQFAVQQLEGLLQTDVFMESVVATAGVELSEHAAFASIQLDEARRAIVAWAASENLVRVNATTADPELSVRLAEASISEFIAFEIAVDVAESKAAEEFFLAQAETHLQDVETARAAVDAYLAQFTAGVTFTPEQQLELDRLSLAESQALDRHSAALEGVQASRLAAAQAETDVSNSMSIIDPPHAPTLPNSDLVGDIITLGMYVLVGLVLMVAGPVIAALLDRSVLFPEDLAHIKGTRVVSVVSRAGRSETRLTHAVLPDQPDPTSPDPGPRPLRADDETVRREVDDGPGSRSRWTRMADQRTGKAPGGRAGTGLNRPDETDPPRRANA